MPRPHSGLALVTVQFPRNHLPELLVGHEHDEIPACNSEEARHAPEMIHLSMSQEIEITLSKEKSFLIILSEVI